MSEHITMLADTDDTAPWLSWMLANTQCGLLVLDSDACVTFANKWLLQRAKLTDESALGRKLMDVFPFLQDTYFEQVLRQAMRTGFPALMSQTLHPSPFPLYAQAAQRQQDKLLRQSIQIIPMGPTDTAQAGQRYTLIQVNDVTPTMKRERLLKAQADKLHDLAHMDALTGIGNRRYFDECLDTECRTALRNRSPLGLVMFDVDYFKQYNDQYGHPAGDRCLHTIAELLSEVCRRPRDIVARYGGEELVAILPDTDLRGSILVADEVLRKLRNLQLPHVTNPSGPIVTLSAGVSLFEPQAGAPSWAVLIEQADQALYAAKKAGRDRVFSCDGNGHITQNL